MRNSSTFKSRFSFRGEVWGKLFSFLLVLVCTFMVLHTASAADYTVTWKFINEFNEEKETVEQYASGAVIQEQYGPYSHRTGGNHYYFSGWLLNGTGDIITFDNTIVADGDKVFVAAYDIVPMFNISFRDVDGAELQKVECDKNALPAFTMSTPAQNGQVFAGWTPAVALATQDASYTATYAQEESTSDALQGAFSVSATKKVRFAKGNLQYNIAQDNWFLAKTQYDIIGDTNINLGAPDFRGTIDMFGWSTTSTNFGVSPSNADADYTGDFRDWGQKIGDEWFTLTREEWIYLYSRQSGNLWGSGMVADRKGLILLPDNWQLPAGIEFTPKYRVNDYSLEDFAKNKYTHAQWQKMEAAGAVFLPAAGRRTGGIGNLMNGASAATFVNPATGYYSFMDNVDVFGYYWSATPSATSGHIASYLIFNGDSYYNLPGVWTCEKRRGQSVRLVRDATYTVTWLNEDGTELEKDENLAPGTTPSYDGSTPVKTATAQEAFVFVGWSPEPTQVNSDVTYTAVFRSVQPSHNVLLKMEHGKIKVTALFPENSNVTLDADADAAPTFKQWDDGSTDLPRTVPANVGDSATAEFNRLEYTVTGQK